MFFYGDCCVVVEIWFHLGWGISKRLISKYFPGARKFNFGNVVNGPTKEKESSSLSGQPIFILNSWVLHNNNYENYETFHRTTKPHSRSHDALQTYQYHLPCTLNKWVTMGQKLKSPIVMFLVPNISMRPDYMNFHTICALKVSIFSL